MNLKLEKQLKKEGQNYHHRLVKGSWHKSGGFMNQSPKVIKKILIINLSRFGDILQTVTALKDYHINHRDHQLFFVGRKEFTKPLNFILDQIFEKVMIMEEVSFEELNSFDFNKVINLTYSDYSSYFTSKIKCQDVFGLTRNKEGQLYIPDSWSQYIFSNVMRGPNCPFSLVDIFKFMLKNSFPVTTKKYRSQTQLITIHPFASQDKKRWTIEKWAQLTNSFFNEHPDYQINVVGSKSEGKEADKFLRLIHPSFRPKINLLVGKYNLQELIAKTRNSEIFIGHDSMIGHLLALYKVQTITLSLGTVRHNETTPYGINNLNVIPQTECFPCFPDTPCQYFACHQDIKINEVIKVVSSIITNKIESDSYTNFSNVVATEIQNDLMIPFYIDPHIKHLSQLFSKYYLVIWSYLFEEKEVNLSLQDLSFSDSFPHNQLNDYVSSTQKLLNLYQFAEKYTCELLDYIEKNRSNIQKDKIKEIVDKVKEIEDLSMLLASRFPLLSPLVDYIFVSLGNSKGDNLEIIATKSALTYKEGIFVCQILMDFLNTTIKKFSISHQGIGTKATSPKKEF